MDTRHPHNIFRGEDPDELLRQAMSTPPDRERRWIRLTEEEAAKLEPMSPDERAAWLADLPTSEYLARTLEADELYELGARAREGEFDDWQSPHATPEIVLYHELRKVGREDLIRRLMAGEFDGTKKESDAWARSADGQGSLARLPKDMRRALGDPYVDTQRNDPCPCGSGVKFKKCHGRAKDLAGG